MRKILIWAMPCVIALTALTHTPALAESETTDTTVPTVSATDLQPVVLTKPYKVSYLSKTKKPKVPLEFWDELARCETGGNWKNGGNWAGGLGIAQSTWYGYGGREFSKSPHLATKEQQIIVANRIAITGYQTKNVFLKESDRPHKPFFRRAVGFSGWGALGCAGGRPGLFRYDYPSMLLHASFTMNQNGTAVAELQRVLRIRVTGNYDKNTRSKHLSYLKRKGESTAGVPSLRSKSVFPASVQAMSVGEARQVVKACPKFEPLMRKYKLPVKTFTRIMWRESRCQPKAIGWNYHSGYGPSNCKLAPAEIYRKCKAVKSFDSGLLQINSSWTTVIAQTCGGRWGDRFVLLTPECNIKVAAVLYDEGKGLSNWKATSGR